MKVLYVAHCTDMSGANKSLVQLIVELRDNYGVEPFVLYPVVGQNEEWSIADALKENHIEGLSHKLICFQRKEHSFLFKLYFLIRGTMFLLQILYHLRGKHFDLVHSNSSVIDTGLYIAKAKNAPHLWHFREVASLSFNYKSILGEKYQRFVYHHSDKVIAISNNVKKEFGDLIPQEKTLVIPNGIKPPYVKVFPNHYSDVVNVCIIGRLEENKNQMEAVKAFMLLPDEFKDKVKLHIIGDASSSYGVALKKYVEDNGLESSVTVYGVRNDVNEFLQNMNIGLMLSKHEAFGRVTVEYMMHKLCVIASNTSANTEIIRDGENGYLYEFGNAKLLAEKIESLVNNREIMKTLSHVGYTDAMANYVSSINSSRVHQVYKEMG